MGSQVMEVAVWLWSLAIVSVFLGLVFNILRGMFDGYMDKWEEKYLVNEKAEYLEENILSVNDPLSGEEEIDDECLFNVKLDYLPDIKSIDLRENDVTGDCDYEFRY